MIDELNESNSFALPEGLNYETIYELVVLPPREALVPAANIGENKSHVNVANLHYHQLISNNENITNDYKKVDNSLLRKFISESKGWELIDSNYSRSQILVKEYTFEFS